MTEPSNPYRQVADALNEADEAIERVDYNVLTEDELRRLLCAKQVVLDLCLDQRQNQRAWGERRS